jgi:hypothetical protein
VPTTTPDETQEEPAEERQRSFWASFSQTDLRLFLVTFAGTVAANVLTVMIVAVAVIAARPENSGRPTASGALDDILVLAIAATLLGISMAAWSPWRPWVGRLRALNVVGPVITVVLGLFTLVYLLILLGYAAGVK